MTENTVLARFADEWLDNWLKSQNRKPLILRGARQVGKSFLVRQLAKRNKRDLAEINFEANPKLGKLFETNEPKNILMVLEQEFQKKLGPESILFFDEIQASPSAIAALRYFYELYPHIPVLAAGSLLEFALQELQFSMPVGRISFLWIYPLRFREFLKARSIIA